MARAPLSIVPDNPPAATPPSDYQSIPSSPADFGGLVAGAQQKLGAEAGQAGNELAGSAEIMQQRFNQIAGDDAMNKFMERGERLTYGTPGNPDDPTSATSLSSDAYSKGLYNLRGAAALRAGPDVVTQLSRLREEIKNGLKNDYQKLQFDEQSRRYFQYKSSEISRHLSGQADVYGKAVNTAAIEVAAINSSNAYTSDGAIAAGMADASQHADKITGIDLGSNPDPKTIEVAQIKAKGVVLQRTIDAALARDPVNGPQRAQQILQTFGGLVDPVLALELQNKTKGIAEQTAGSQAGSAAFYRATGQSSARAPITANDLPPEAAQFLPALAQGEDAGMAYGAPAPKGDRSGAAWDNNRYQFINNTWAGEAPKAGVGVNDKSPASQDKVAWNYANNVYKTNTGGRDLATDIRDGGHEATIALALNKVWTSLPGGNEQGKPTGISMSDWLARMRAPVVTTLNDAKPPLTGDQILMGQRAIDNDPRLASPQARNLAHAEFERHIQTYNQALKADAETALNDWTTRIIQSPLSISPTNIANDRRLTGEQKSHLVTELTNTQSGRSQGDGPLFSQTFENVYAPPGSPGRINSETDLIPLLGNGLTYSGLEKVQRAMKERGTPDGQVLHAATQAWQRVITHQLKDGMDYTPSAYSLGQWTSFLGTMNDVIQQEKAKGTPMSQIVAENGPIAKMVPNYIHPERAFQGMVSNASPGPRTTSVLPAPTLASGKTYLPNGSGGFIEVAPGTPNARVYIGGPLVRENFQEPPHPSAPTQ